jgi:hypothetical protein
LFDTLIQLTTLPFNKPLELNDELIN